MVIPCVGRTVEKRSRVPSPTKYRPFAVLNLHSYTYSFFEQNNKFAVRMRMRRLHRHFPPSLDLEMA